MNIIYCILNNEEVIIMAIYLVRHGSDDDKYRGGWSNLGLTEEGVV